MEKIIGDLERAGGARRTLEPVAGGAATPARPQGQGLIRTGVAAGKVIPEGTILPSRRGRVVKSAAGDWVFVFDAGTDGAADPPMILMPCQVLMNIERTAEARGEGTTFTLSGQVFVYHDRNYLLPTIALVNRRSDEVMPTQ